jgi:hypothetical protein
MCGTCIGCLFPTTSHNHNLTLQIWVVVMVRPKPPLAARTSRQASMYSLSSPAPHTHTHTHAPTHTHTHTHTQRTTTSTRLQEESDLHRGSDGEEEVGARQDSGGKEPGPDSAMEQLVAMTPCLGATFELVKDSPGVTVCSVRLGKLPVLSLVYCKCVCEGGLCVSVGDAGTGNIPCRDCDW